MIDREKLLAAARAKREEMVGKDKRITALQDALDSYEEKMHTIANLFSASVWKILPQKIKTYFESYREDK